MRRSASWSPVVVSGLSVLLTAGCGIPKPRVEPIPPIPAEVALPPLDSPASMGAAPMVLPESAPTPTSEPFSVKLQSGLPSGPKAVVPLLGQGRGDVGSPLRLVSVLESVEKHYPLLQAAEEEREIAGGRLLSAMGAFDTQLRVSNTNVPEGTYENNRLLATVDQALPFTGASLFSSYKYGAGDFPSYGGGAKTADRGEIRGGVNIPLLRDSTIDRRRAALAQARIGQPLTEAQIERQRLDFSRAAAKVYWAWVAAGHRVRLGEELVRLANERDGQLERLVSLQQASPLERMDNQQSLVARNTVLIDAQLRLQQASLDLSLFWRDEAGEPIVPNSANLPDFPPLTAIEVGTLAGAVETALARRPELRRLRLQRESAEIELRWAENQTLPQLNAFVAGARDMGKDKASAGSSPLDRESVEVGFELALPLQLRDARGRAQVASAQVRQLQRQEKFTADSIRAEVQSVFSVLDRSFELWSQAASRCKLAGNVAAGERRLFDLGQSDILRVTLREQAAFDAQLTELSAKLEYFRARADYLAAMGTGDHPGAMAVAPTAVTTIADSGD